MSSDNRLSTHARLGHKVVVWWDVPYHHMTEWNEKDQTLVVFTETAKSGDGCGDNDYWCRTCDMQLIDDHKVEVDYV